MVAAGRRWSGAGVVGLCCAVRLLEAGHRVDVLARDLPLETTSSVAAAHLVPLPGASPGQGDRLGRGDATTSCAARRRRRADGRRDAARHGGLASRTPDPWWVGAVPVLDRVAAAPAYADAWSFAAPVVEMPVYLTGCGHGSRAGRHGHPAGAGATCPRAAGGRLRRPGLAAAGRRPPCRCAVRWSWSSRSASTVVARRGRSDVRRPAQLTTSWSAAPTTRGSGAARPPRDRDRHPPGPPGWSPSWRGGGCCATGSGCARRARRCASKRSARRPLLRPRRRRRHAQLGLRRRGDPPVGGAGCPPGVSGPTVTRA